MRWLGVTLAIVAIVLVFARKEQFLLQLQYLLTDKKDVGTNLQSQNTKESLEEAWSRVLEAPKNPQSWITFGEVSEHNQQFDSAEQAYRTAIRNGDNTGTAQMRLGFLLYAMGRDQEALSSLEIARKIGVQDPMLAYNIKRIKENLVSDTPANASAKLESIPFPHDDEQEISARPVYETPQPRSPGAACSIPVDKKNGIYSVSVLLNYQAVELIVDTGASLSLVRSDVAAQVGLELNDEVITAETAAGIAEFKLGLVRHAKLNSPKALASLKDISMAICSDCLESVADGLLGLDLQREFNISLDVSAGVLRFNDCLQ